MYPVGNSFWVYYSNHTEPTLLEDAGQGQEPQRSSALKSVTQWNTCIDIGSNVGQWTRPLLERFKKVICFEPNPMFRECFLKNIPLDRVELFPYGLSNHTHTATQAPNATFLNDTVGDTEPRPGDIECRTLDSFGFTDIDFIKIDVDGFEVPLLEGAVETLQKNNAVINIEMKRRKRPGICSKAQTILESLGYKQVSRVRSDEVWLKSL
jgi:FkbM family methyltransferase